MLSKVTCLIEGLIELLCDDCDKSDVICCLKISAHTVISVLFVGLSLRKDDRKRFSDLFATVIVSNCFILLLLCVVR